MPQALRRWLAMLGGVFVVSCGLGGGRLGAQELPLSSEMTHLRVGAKREWSTFPEDCRQTELKVPFQAEANDQELTLLLRQEDVKERWRVRINDTLLGELTQDESPVEMAFAVPPGTLKDLRNELTIWPVNQRQSDDIRVGQVRLVSVPRERHLGQCRVSLSLRDRQTGSPLPGRFTIVTAEGALPALGAQSSRTTAVRPGVIYASTGAAETGLPPGEYAVFAGRGFEYSIDQQKLSLQPGAEASVSVAIERVVDTRGYIACDTHIHTLTHSGHGDCSLPERMITLVGEGIELAIATDHNSQIDYEATARELQVRQFFTPVIGNELTTPVGHFNIFPISAHAPLPDHALRDWGRIREELELTSQPAVVILNHARDIHSGVRPFGPDHYNALVAEQLDGWPLFLNAMEVANSGATQTHPLQLLRDWMGLLNRGLKITPVGCSDSHDVSRYIVGQGRTYIRCPDADPGAIDVAQAIESFRRGEVIVSQGLWVELLVDGTPAHGKLIGNLDPELSLTLRIRGPEWTQAERFMLFTNGQLVREEQIPERSAQAAPGVLWSGEWTLPRPRHDCTLVAVAIGPGIQELHWPIARPYQPSSTDPRTYVLGCSGAIWCDGDGDGKWTSPHERAQSLLSQGLPAALEQMRSEDWAVAAQVAHGYVQSGGKPDSAEYQAALQSEAPAIREGFRAYLESLRETERARLLK